MIPGEKHHAWCNEEEKAEGQNDVIRREYVLDYAPFHKLDQAKGGCQVRAHDLGHSAFPELLEKLLSSGIISGERSGDVASDTIQRYLSNLNSSEAGGFAV